MKKLIETNELSGLEIYLDERITVFCCRYIYTGKLESIEDFSIELSDAHIVYETGSFTEKDWKDAQKLPNDKFCIAKQSIESFGLMK